MQAIHQQIHMLVRTIGSSSELLDIISDPHNGSEKLLIQVLIHFIVQLMLAWKQKYSLNILNFGHDSRFCKR